MPTCLARCHPAVERLAELSLRQSQKTSSSCCSLSGSTLFVCYLQAVGALACALWTTATACQLSAVHLGSTIPDPVVILCNTLLYCMLRAGSRRFGMCFADDVGRISGIGTTLEIQDFLIESSGRMYVTNKGIERFKVTKVVKQQPVLVCEVEVLPEDDDQSDEVSRRV